MAIAFPNVAAQSALTARTYATVDFGQYVDTTSTAAEPRTFRVDSTIVPGGKSSILLRADVRKMFSGVPADFAAYMVLRGHLDRFTETVLNEELRFVALQGTAPNLLAIMRGER